MKKYFQKIAKDEWYPNTLFVITGDHTAPNNILFEESMTAKGLFSVPIIFFRPDNSLAGVDTTRIIQHADIMPSVLGYLNFKKNFLSFGQNIFEDGHSACAWNFRDEQFYFYEGDYLLVFDGRISSALFNFKTDLYLKYDLTGNNEMKPVIARMETRIKGIIQQYNNRMVDNNLTIKSN